MCSDRTCYVAGLSGFGSSSRYDDVALCGVLLAILIARASDITWQLRVYYSTICDDGWILSQFK